MQKKECPECGGGGVIQQSWNRGYYGVCQSCQGSGTIYFIGNKEVSKEEYEDAEWD